jgi:hypothetical protein
VSEPAGVARVPTRDDRGPTDGAYKQPPSLEGSVTTTELFTAPLQLAAVVTLRPAPAGRFSWRFPIPGAAMDEPIPHPVLLNTWKHHAGWLRWRIGRAVAGGAAGVAELAGELVVVGARLMDLYTGSLAPAGIAREALALIAADGLASFEPLSASLAARGGYLLVTLSDGSAWTVRLGPAEGRFVHLHPGRWAAHTLRVPANTLKSAVLAHAIAGLSGRSAADLDVVNEARRMYIGLPPVRWLDADGGLGAVIAALG